MISATPERIELQLDNLDDIVKRASTEVLSEDDQKKLRMLLDAYVTLTNLIQEDGTTLRKLRGLFRTTEKTSEVLGDGPAPPGDPGAANPAENKAGASVEPPPPLKPPKEPRPGHGRNAASAYTGAARIPVDHDKLKPGDPCPSCHKGKLYKQSRPAVIVHITGGPPLGADVYEAERLRCNPCGEVFTAPLPDGVADRKYNATAAAMIALLKYGSGLPFNRLESLQGALGVPLPASTQWDIVADAAAVAGAAFDALIDYAAGGELFHNDDTSMRILALKNVPPTKEDGIDPERTGMFTTGIVSIRDDRKVALFFTGRQHAGENLAAVLSRRSQALKAPIQMSDALSRNLPKEFEVIVAHCLVHGRRNFVNVFENFPDACRHVLLELAKVYKVDATAKQLELSRAERLELHQRESTPVMDELEKWLAKQIDDKQVEPNSGLGKAIRYMQNHWEKLTLFLRQEGAPLDNNICERVLKKAILHRKNSLFFKTTNGARVGDTFQSLIHTVELGGGNPFHYLTTLLEHRTEVTLNPQQWLPWNYEDAVSRLSRS